MTIRNSNKNAYIFLFLIVITIFASYLTSFNNAHNWGDDFAAYIDQARSITEGTYNELYLVNKFRFDNSTQKGIGPIFYPWGFPILLSPVYYAFGLDIYIMKVYITIFFLLSLLIVFLLFKETLNNYKCLLLVAIIGFSTWFLDLKEHILSDTPFMFFALFSVYLINKIIVKKDILLNKYASYFLIGLIISISFSIRSTGILLLPALLLAQYVEGRNKGIRNIIFNRYNFIPYLVFVLSNIIIMATLPRGGSGYIDDLSITGTTTIIKNLAYYTVLPSRFFPFMHIDVYYPSYFAYSKFSLLFYLFMLVFITFGIAISFKRNYLYVFYGLINLAILIYWPHRQGFRFIIHIFPFFLYFLFIGLSRIDLWTNISEKAAPLKVNIAVLFGAGLVLISLAYFSHDTYKRIIFNKTNITEGPFSPDSMEFFEYIKNNTAKDDAIIFFKPRAMHLFTRRKSLTLNRHISIPDSILNSPARYVAINKKPLTPADLTIQDIPNSLYCEFENNTFMLCALQKKADH